MTLVTAEIRGRGGGWKTFYLPLRRGNVRPLHGNEDYKGERALLLVIPFLTKESLDFNPLFANYAVMYIGCLISHDAIERGVILNLKVG